MISIKNAYTFAWVTFKKKWKLFLAICLVLFATSLLSSAGNVFQSLLTNRVAFITVTVFFWMIYLFLNAFLNAGFKRILLSLVSGKDPQFTDIIASKKDALKFLLGQLIVFLAVFCLMLVFVLLLNLALPLGVSMLWGQVIIVAVLLVLLLILACRFGFWSFIMLDKNISPLRAFGWSKKITKGKAKYVAAFFLVSGLAAGLLLIIVALVPVINFILIVVALCFVVSLVSLASVHVYHQLLTLSKVADASSVPHKNGAHSEAHLSPDTDVVVQSKEIEAPNEA